MALGSISWFNIMFPDTDIVVTFRLTINSNQLSLSLANHFFVNTKSTRGPEIFLPITENIRQYYSFGNI